jgi:hypothetical protein
VADSERDKQMRLVGELRCVVQILEMINVPHEDRRVAELKDSAQALLRKAMLAAWERADSMGSGATVGARHE